MTHLQLPQSWQKMVGEWVICRARSQEAVLPKTCHRFANVARSALWRECRYGPSC